MNIFVLDKNPRKAAQMLCDQHIVKMILESAQMLCTAHWQTGSKAPYKPTHINHPCTIWTRESKANYKWLTKHADKLCKEYTQRYKKIHKTQEVINWCKQNIPKLSKTKLTSFAQAMPEKYKDKNPVKAYRNFYLNEKMKFAKYNYCKKPKWIK